MTTRWALSGSARLDRIGHALPRGRLRDGWRSLRTDLSWLLRDLRGERRPTRVERGKSRYRGLIASARPLRVVEVVRETADAVSLALEEASGAPVAFEAGQFLTFNLSVGGRILRRAYSLSSSPLDGRAVITVKRIGEGSAFMHSLRPGAVLAALGPSGAFLLPEADERAVVMIAGGSGITPIISLAETLLRTRPGVRVRLIYGSRVWADVIFAERLAALATDHPRLSIEHVLHAPREEWTGARGLLDRAAIEARIEDVGALFYLCGPAAMMDAAREALLGRGVAPDRIREERFHSPSRAEIELAPQRATMRVDGHEHAVRVEPGQTLLEAGLSAGAALPFSCAMGGCGACKVKLVSGTVHTDEPSCLSPSERAAGYVLTCCSRPTSPVVLEVDR